LLTAIGLTPSGSSRVHIDTQTIYRTNKFSTQDNSKYTEQNKIHITQKHRTTQIHSTTQLKYTEQHI